MSNSRTTTRQDNSAIDILISLDRWLMWRTEVRRVHRSRHRANGGQADQSSLRPHISPAVWNKASSTDPTTWQTFDEAMACNDARAKAFEGIGIVLGDLNIGCHLCGFDLNSCIVDGVVADWAIAILNLLCVDLCRGFTERHRAESVLLCARRCSRKRPQAVRYR